MIPILIGQMSKNEMGWGRGKGRNSLLNVFAKYTPSLFSFIMIFRSKSLLKHVRFKYYLIQEGILR